MSPIGTRVLVVHYGTLMTTRSQAFLDYPSLGEPDAPLRMDYYFWVVRRGDQVLLVDTGFDPDVGRRRGRTVFFPPVDALGALGIRPEQVRDIVVTHFHYDHIGNVSAFPQARLWVQEKEYRYWRDDIGADASLREFVEQAELDVVYAAADAGRVTFIDGDAEPIPGVQVHLVGGHTPGQQIVRIETDVRPVVIASDACHFDEEIVRDRPHSVVTDVSEMLAGYEMLRSFEAAGALVLAGHDPGIPHHLGALVRLGDGAIFSTTEA
jgi:glyoxylase-like metal-dependent hydrolase (beta-lactamase superfamily II)